MKKILRKMKKPSALLALTLLSLSLFAQEADDGFVVPLGEDLSNAIGSSGAEGNLGFGDAPSDNTGGGYYYKHDGGGSFTKHSDGAVD